MALTGPHCLPLHPTVWLKLHKPWVKPQHCNSLPGFFLLSPARLLCNHPFSWTEPGDCTPLHFQPFQSILRCVRSAQSCCEDEETLSYNKGKAIMMWFLSLYYPQVPKNHDVTMFSVFIHKFLGKICKSLPCWLPWSSYSLSTSLLFSVKCGHGIR